MKKLNLLILSIVMCLLSACHGNLWDAIEDLDSRVARLEELCKEMNTNISSLQTIVSVIQENDVITAIVPIEKDGKVIGYTITFDKHDPITIYNGIDGKDGANGQNGMNGTNGIDGKDGQTPIIGVAKDVDGVYYWTLNGEWLLDADGDKIRVTGEDGKDGQDGADGKDGVDGKDGQDGTNGTNGKDGVTPQLKIEEGYWYVSYDNGATWIEVGKAVGEDGKDGANGTNGTNGKDGQDGDSMFASVTYDEKNVTLTLADGTKIIILRDTIKESLKVDLVIFMGQSNMVGRGDAFQAPVVEEGHGYEFRAISDPTKLYPIVEPFGENENNSNSGISDSGRTGSLVSAFVEEYYKYSQVPIVGVSCSVGGTASEFWLPNKAPLNDAICRYNSAKIWLETNGYTIRHAYMVWLQGEGDAKTGVSTEQYASNLTAIIEEMIKKTSIEFCALIRIGHFRSNLRNKDIIYSQTNLCKTYEKAVMVSTMLAGCTEDQMKDLSHYTQATYNKVGMDAGKHTAYYINTGIKPSMYDPEYDNYFPYEKIQKVWSVATNLGYGTEYVGVKQVVDGEYYLGFINLSEGYLFGEYSITMGDEEIIPNVDGNKMVIEIGNVVEDVNISVATISENEYVYNIGDTLRFDNMEGVATTKIIDKYYSFDENTSMLTILERSGYRSWKNIPLYAGQQYKFNSKSSLVVLYDDNENVISSFNIRNSYGTDGVVPIIEQDCFMAITMSYSFVPNDIDCTIMRIK